LGICGKRKSKVSGFLLGGGYLWISELVEMSFALSAFLGAISFFLQQELALLPTVSQRVLSK
jgi:hypothetical protein